MNLLGREHRVSFVLSSHARFLSGAHEGQWRYRYVYCQNDPVALIDPTGYSPENTGTPARFTPMNYANIRSSEGGITSCYLEDYTPVVAEVQDPHRSPINLNEERRLAAMRRAAERDSNPRFIEGAFGSNDGCSEYYTYVNVGGELVKVRYDKDGNILGIEYNGENGEIVATAIHMAFLRIRNEGGITNADELRSLLESINAFASNFSMFSQILNSNVADALFQFTYHAMIGGYVATHMQKYDNPGGINKDQNPNYDQYDMTIGFWVSFWAMRSGIKMGILPITEGIPHENSQSNLVDLANIVKAMAFRESELGYSKWGGEGAWKEPDVNGDAGLMQVDQSASNWDFLTSRIASTFGKGLNFFEYDGPNGQFNTPLNNIGIGVGHLFGKLTGLEKSYLYSEGYREAPTIGQWLNAAQLYNGSGAAAEAYRSDIKSTIITGKSLKQGNYIMSSSYIEAYYRTRKRRRGGREILEP